MYCRHLVVPELLLELVEEPHDLEASAVLNNMALKNFFSQQLDIHVTTDIDKRTLFQLNNFYQFIVALDSTLEHHIVDEVIQGLLSYVMLCHNIDSVSRVPHPLWYMSVPLNVYKLRNH